MKIGFIGGSGHHYLRGALRGPRVSFAVCGDGHDQEAARAFAKNYAAPLWFETPAELLAEFQPDIVSVGGVYGFNADMIELALERGVPVVSDKPIASNVAQLERLRALVAVNPSAVILTEFDFRSRREFRAARDAVREGLVGEVTLVTGQKSYRFGTRPPWYNDRDSYPGILMWVLSHTIDAMTFVTGRTIKRAVGRGGNLSQPAFAKMEDHVAVLCELSGGATAAMHADFLRPRAAATHGDDRLRVAGSKGVLEVRDDRCRLITHDSPEVDITERATVRPIHEELLAAVRGEKSDLYSTQLSLERAHVLLKLRDASDRGEWVEL